MATDQETRTWILDPNWVFDEGQKFIAECRESGFRSFVPLNEISYCPYCGKWLSAPTPEA